MNNHTTAGAAKRKLNVISYRIKQFMNEKAIVCSNKKNVIFERIIRTVELHQNAKKLFKLLTTSFTIYFLILLVSGMCSFVVALYRLLYTIICMDNFIELMIAVSYIMGHEFYLFGTAYLGQLMVNHADELFDAIYMSLWYKAPIPIQKLLLFIMQISLKSVVPSLGGIYISVLKSFTSFMSTVISYCMVIYSVSV
ncbi:uncharacterized protein LOC105839791 isoform X2 [Monomorium pharaonis]|uniref:uncharacterized protein LOC105839791 isoform X2 n=1 Tax=Monomorium pharaonis TaxID=307658 RepID=UPI001746FC15|nr:uncharacterized protein LOC105839791 isoform X2 [Monomorium pharaonis]